jgi:hypothetical protein
LFLFDKKLEMPRRRAQDGSEVRMQRNVHLDWAAMLALGLRVAEAAISDVVRPETHDGLAAARWFKKECHREPCLGGNWVSFFELLNLVNRR